MSKKITTRFAPSPTGFLHVGGLRTALYNYLHAKNNDGQALLRIEDTDQSRKVEGAVEGLIKSLNSFGLIWDDKPIIQSKRLDIYKKYAENLVNRGKAYRCFCTKECLDDLRKTQQKQGFPPMYDGRCSKLSKQEVEQKIKEGTPNVIRFYMPKSGQTELDDLVRGNVKFDNKLLDDPIIFKSDGFPTYHLASVVDDHEMEITTVIRGEEWLPSAPKHIALYQAFNWQLPQFAHLPLLLNPDKSKLSKRQGDVAVEDYLAKGYLPEALLNFVLLLGWNPKTDQEIFNLEEMIKQFDFKKVNKAGAVFDTQKLDWLNGQYIKNLSDKKFTEICLPFFEKEGVKVNKDSLEKIVKTEKERIKRLDEIVENTKFFFELPKYASEILVWKKSDKNSTIKNLEELISFLSEVKDKDFNEHWLEENTKKLIEKLGIGVGDMLWPMRVSLSGQKNSPGPFEIAWALGKEESLNRLNQAISSLKNA